MASPVADIFRQAAARNRDDDQRRGNVVFPPDGCEMVVAGDLHGSRVSLAGIVRYADLGAAPSRCLVLQEILHGPPDPTTKKDRSIEVLLRAARLKIAHPQQVHFLLSNHAVAQITGNEISRDGQPSCKTFTEGVAFAFPDAMEEILEAVEEFLLSQPLAVRCPNGVLISHSLPSTTRDLDGCIAALERPCAGDDLRRGGPVYDWTWTRRHKPEKLEELAQRLGVELFVLGHLHPPEGFEIIGPRALVLLSDSLHGYVLPFVSDQPLTVEAARNALKSIASLGGTA